MTKLFFLMTQFFLASCDYQREKLTTSAEPTEPLSPPSLAPETITYSELYNEIFKNCVGCHKPPNIMNLIDVSTCDALIQSPGLKNPPAIAPGSPEKSGVVIWLKAKKMPPPGSPIPTEEQIQRLESWVKSGASCKE